MDISPEAWKFQCLFIYFYHQEGMVVSEILFIYFVTQKKMKPQQKIMLIQQI